MPSFSRLTPYMLLVLLGAAPIVTQAEERVRLADLRGQWKFHTGDNLTWKSLDFDDSEWSTIFVPSAWEDEGYPGYDGYAWYRITVLFTEAPEEYEVKLDAGRIDDADQIWINGTLVGAGGGFPPEYFTAYSKFRKYAVPDGLLQAGKNVIAIRVYDEKLVGGILEGNLGLFGTRKGNERTKDLSGIWKLHTGDEPGWKYEAVDEQEWQDVMVPMLWDAQGLARFDGIAWYRKHFLWDSELATGLYLNLGFIDDFDEVFLNGTRIGATGIIPNEGEWPAFHDEYVTPRSYRIPDGLLRSGMNLLSVRVFDGGHDGGIYEGPVNISTTPQRPDDGNNEPVLVYRPADQPWYEKLLQLFLDWIKELFR